MLNETIQQLRKSKGMSQEQLAARLHVVRQTVSKWEKGLSVPDSAMLIRIAEELNVSVGTLLGETPSPETPGGETDWKAINDKLEALNEQYAGRLERLRKRWRAASLLLGVAAVLVLLRLLAGFLWREAQLNALFASEAVIGGNDGPTNLFVSSVSPQMLALLFALLAAVVAAAGLYKTRRK